MNLGDIRMPWGLWAQPPDQMRSASAIGPYPRAAPGRPSPGGAPALGRQPEASPAPTSRERPAPLSRQGSAAHAAGWRLGREPTQVSQMRARHRHATAPTLRARPCPTPSQRVRQHSGASPKQVPLRPHESAPHRWPGRVWRRVPPGGSRGAAPRAAPSLGQSKGAPATGTHGPPPSCAPALGRPVRINRGSKPPASPAPRRTPPGPPAAAPAPPRSRPSGGAPPCSRRRP